MYDTIVIGAGLFGSIIARGLKDIGQNVLVLDKQHEHRGSKPAACLMKPSWLGSLSKEQQRASLAFLDDAYGVQDLEFQAGPVRTKVHWVPPKSILTRWGVVNNEPLLIRQYESGWEVLCETQTYTARCIVVAAGVWANQVLSRVSTIKDPAGRAVQAVENLQSQAGMALLFPTTRTDNVISPWAPYKQLVRFNRGDGAWVGDGTAIKEANWDAARTAQVEERCKRFLAPSGITPTPQRLYGLRPYVKNMHGNPAYLEQHAPGIWVATGGAKNGTIGAAWCATELVRRFS